MLLGMEAQLPGFGRLYWLGEGSTKKENRARRRGHFCIGVGVVEFTVWCKHHMSEVLVERKPYFMAVRPRSACFQVYVLRAFVSSEFSLRRS
jgi:hypothetical protein